MFKDFELKSTHDIMFALEGLPYYDTVFGECILEAVENTVQDLKIKPCDYNKRFENIDKHIRENYI